MNNKLNKKIEIVEGEVKVYEGNTFVGFLFCMFILLIIGGIFYYLESNNITHVTNLF